jgi:hypothetical protein
MRMRRGPEVVGAGLRDDELVAALEQAADAARGLRVRSPRTK